jgi:putative ABC transport system substrate-binding protein
MLIAGSASDPANGAFVQGMRERGYIEGKNVVFDRRFADGRIERLPAMAVELVAAKADVIFAPVTPAALAARRATREIPIVFAVSADPVGSGLAATLARPGGNVTGLTSLNVELVGKRMELLKELSPRISRVAILFNPDNSPDRLQLAALEQAATPLGITVIRLPARTADGLQAVLGTARKERAEALMVIPSPLNLRLRPRVLDYAIKNRLPTMEAEETAAPAGALLSYSISWSDNFRRAANYVDRILKGAKPSDLPIEQPTRLELVINLKTAKAIGLTVPRGLMLRVDRVIE